MREYSYSLTSYRGIDECIDSFLEDCQLVYTALVVSIYTCCSREARIRHMVNAVHARLPHAVIAGSTASGEIYAGESRRESTLVRFRVFERSRAVLRSVDVADGSPRQAGMRLAADAEALEHLVGIELLCTVKNFNAFPLLEQLSELPEEVRIFGGGADTYAVNGMSLVFSSDGIFEKGVIAVCFCGEELAIDTHAVWGWKPLGRRFHITGLDGGTLVREFDQQPAVRIYERYLRIRPSDWFGEKAIEFPVMVERDGKQLARVPITYTAEGALLFAADFKPGEEVRLSYGDPMDIIAQCTSSCRQLSEFHPEALQIFSCVTRRQFLHDNINMELGAYQKVAPTSGFYTYGEIFRVGREVNILNVTSVLAGFREGGEAQTKPVVVTPPEEAIDSKLTTVQRLAHFIAMISGELEEVNQKLDILARQDRLTKLCNRGEIEANLQHEIAMLGTGELRLAILMLDLDHFKAINDTFGHDVGDRVLQAVAQTLRETTRCMDGCGRWGGEEFMVILPNADAIAALGIAERIRSRLQSIDILPDGSPVTASFGVAEYHVGESYQEFYRRLDAALYEAKAAGRNQVVLAPDKYSAPEANDGDE